VETKRIKILFVDDNEILRNSVAQDLIKEGYDAHAINLKRDACDWIIENKPDLVISDIKSPGMDGFEFLKWLKTNLNTKEVPFIFLTGFADIVNAMKAKRMSAVDFLSKPYELSELLFSIRRAIKTR
jgi:DNA-binding NtrC family response regulator